MMLRGSAGARMSINPLLTAVNCFFFRAGSLGMSLAYLQGQRQSKLEEGRLNFHKRGLSGGSFFVGFY